MNVETHTVNGEEIAEITTDGPTVFVFSDGIAAFYLDGRCLVDAPHSANPAYYAYRVALITGSALEWRGCFFVEAGTITEDDLVKTREET